LPSPYKWQIGGPLHCLCHGEVLPSPIALCRWWSSCATGNKGEKKGNFFHLFSFVFFIFSYSFVFSSYFLVFSKDGLFLGWSILFYFLKNFLKESNVNICICLGKNWVICKSFYKCLHFRLQGICFGVLVFWFIIHGLYIFFPFFFPS